MHNPFPDLTGSARIKRTLSDMIKDVERYEYLATEALERCKVARDEIDDALNNLVSLNSALAAFRTRIAVTHSNLSEDLD